jgi:hypothetical protein
MLYNELRTAVYNILSYFMIINFVYTIREEGWMGEIQGSVISTRMRLTNRHIHIESVVYI